MPSSHQSQANMMHEPLHYYNSNYYGVSAGSTNNLLYQRDPKHFGLSNQLNQGQQHQRASYSRLASEYN
jgi:hypothetical protein